jgi:hypothetical protein
MWACPILNGGKIRSGSYLSGSLRRGALKFPQATSLACHYWDPGTSLLHLLWFVRNILEQKPVEGPRVDCPLTHEKYLGTEKPWGVTHGWPGG